MDPVPDANVVGSYRILGRTDSKAGGQGRIYRAECLSDTETLQQGAIVALKDMHTPFESEKQLKRAQRTVDLLKKNPHPGVVGYHDFFISQAGSFSERQCVVMNLLEGETLQERIHSKRHGMNWEDVQTIFSTCLGALIHTKSLGIIHRDLKPSNIFLSEEGGEGCGQCRLIDFEVARHETETQSTHTGMHGSFDYMAPDFHPVHVPTSAFSGDELSDIYSFCVCLYEALTGKLPFPKTESQGAQSFFERYHDAESLELHFPRRIFKPISGLEAFLRKGLAVKREARFQTFQGMKSAFETLKRLQVGGPNYHYTFTRWIGRGGFADVFKAQRSGSEGEVAVKCLRRANYAPQFIKEAKLLQSVQHPHIVKELDFFRHPDVERYFLVMEYLPGMPGNSLRGRLKKSKVGLPLEEGIRLFCGYLSALQALHSDYQIIHRDIKPGNLFAPEGHPDDAKLLDLGIARDMSGTVSIGPVPGTFEYMAPEFAVDKQSRGSPQTDFFSLALCLFETLTGATVYPPLPKASGASMAAFFERSRSPAALDFSHPVFATAPGLKNVFRVALAHSPQNRFSSAEQFRSELVLASGLKGILPEQKKIKPREKQVREERITGPDDAYLLGPQVGKGGFADVYKATRESDGQEVALKCLRRGQYAPQFIKEARLVQDCDHPYIVKAHRFFKLQNTERYFLVMEYLPGMPGFSLRGRIHQQRNGLPVDEAVAIFARYLSALDTLHVKYSIIHRDIKPGNLYAPVHQPEGARLLDLGVARDLRGTHSVGPVHGTLEFMAPEFALQSDTRGTPQTDIYALGLCFYEALTGRPIFPPLPQTSDQECFQEFFLRSKQPPTISFEHPVFRDFPNLQRVIQNATAYHADDRYVSAALFFREMAVATGMRELISTIPLVSDTDEEEETQFLDFETARTNLLPEDQVSSPDRVSKPSVAPRTRKIPEPVAPSGQIPDHGNTGHAPVPQKRNKLRKRKGPPIPQPVEETANQKRFFSPQMVLIPLSVFLLILGGTWGFFWWRISGMNESLNRLHPELLNPERAEEWLGAIQRIQQTQRWASQNKKLALFQLPIGPLLIKAEEKQTEIVSGLEAFTSRQPSESLEERIQAGEQLLEVVDVLTFLSFSEEQRFQSELQNANAFLANRSGSVVIDLRQVEGPVDRIRLTSGDQSELPLDLQVGNETKVDLPFGVYTLQITRNGYEPFTHRMRVFEDQTRVTIRPRWVMQPWMRHLEAMEESVVKDETEQLFRLWEDVLTSQIAATDGDMQERLSRVREEVEIRRRIQEELKRTAQVEERERTEIQEGLNQVRADMDRYQATGALDVQSWSTQIEDVSRRIEASKNPELFANVLEGLKSRMIILTEKHIEVGDATDLENTLSKLDSESVRNVLGSDAVQALTQQTQARIKTVESQRIEEERRNQLAQDEERKRRRYRQLHQTVSDQGDTVFEELELLSQHMKILEREEDEIDSVQRRTLEKILEERRTLSQRNLQNLIQKLKETVTGREQTLQALISQRKTLEVVLGQEFYRSVIEEIDAMSNVSLILFQNQSPQNSTVALFDESFQLGRGEEKLFSLPHGGKEISYVVRVYQDGYQEKRVTGKLAPMEGRVIRFDQELEVEPIALSMRRDPDVTLRVQLEDNWRDVKESFLSLEVTPPVTVRYEWRKPDYLPVQGKFVMKIGDQNSHLSTPVGSAWKATPALTALNQARGYYQKQEDVLARKTVPSDPMEDPVHEKQRREILQWLELKKKIAGGQIGELLQEVGSITDLERAYPSVAAQVKSEVWKLDDHPERLFVHNQQEVITYRVTELKQMRRVDPAISRLFFQIGTPVAGNLAWIPIDIEKQPEFRVLYERKEDVDPVSKIHLFYMDALKSLPDYSIAAEQTLTGLIQEVERDQWRPSDFALAAFCEAQLRQNRWASYKSAIRRDGNPFDESRMLQVVRLSEQTKHLAEVWNQHRADKKWRDQVTALIESWGESRHVSFPVWYPHKFSIPDSLQLYPTYAGNIRENSKFRNRLEEVNSIFAVEKLIK